VLRVTNAAYTLVRELKGGNYSCFSLLSLLASLLVFPLPSLISFLLCWGLNQSSAPLLELHPQLSVLTFKRKLTSKGAGTEGMGGSGGSKQREQHK
jgi:hypothetical protein